MDKNEYLTAISRLRDVQRRLNDIYIWSRMAIEALRAIENRKDLFKKYSSFPVPSTVQDKRVSRNPDSIVESISKARKTELYKALVVYVVSLVEPVLTKIITLTLSFDKRRIKTKPKKSEGKIEYDTVIDCDNYSDVLDIIISKHISVFEYSTPNDQLEYITKLLSISIDQDIWDRWIEIKATRDLIVHNSCKVNKVYIDKVGASARAEIGKEVIVDESYFADVLVTTKSLIGQIVYRAVKNQDKQ